MYMNEKKSEKKLVKKQQKKKRKKKKFVRKNVNHIACLSIPSFVIFHGFS